jgi:hypothetical protein
LTLSRTHQLALQWPVLYPWIRDSKDKKGIPEFSTCLAQSLYSFIYKSQS